MLLFPVGLSFSKLADSLCLTPGFVLPRRIPREDLPLTSNVSVGVRRKLSKKSVVNTSSSCSSGVYNGKSRPSVGFFSTRTRINVSLSLRNSLPLDD